ncbi:hypothetical protein BSKO_05109 [Bryopsis sp. KO-2023]|nr:hypothetical protein BSKO_05109 [Bryopsis sp. KO-2023]
MGTRLRNIDVTGLRLRYIDAKGEVVGRLAAQLSKILQGKDKPSYAPNKDSGDVCIVVNASKVELTGKKWKQKEYVWHTGYMGGLKKKSVQDVFDKKPEDVLWRAVNGMLPKNNLRRYRMRKLRIFPEDYIPEYASMHPLVPWEMPERKLRDRGKGFTLPQGALPMNPEAYMRRMKSSPKYETAKERYLRGEFDAPEEEVVIAGTPPEGWTPKTWEEEGEKKRKEDEAARKK